MGDHQMLTPTEFRDAGYLQEANRLFFHPLGLAMAAWPDEDLDDDGAMRVQIWDHRDDPEGFLFVALTDDDTVAKAERVGIEMLTKRQQRIAVLGHVDTAAAAAVQPIGSHLEAVNDE